VQRSTRFRLHYKCCKECFQIVLQTLQRTLSNCVTDEQNSEPNKNLRKKHRTTYFNAAEQQHVDGGESVLS